MKTTRLLYVYWQDKPVLINFNLDMNRELQIKTNETAAIIIIKSPPSCFENLFLYVTS